MKGKKNAGKVVKGVLLALLALVLAGAAGTWALFGTFFKAANSIQKLEEGLYCMEYRGDYGLEEFLAQGGTDSDDALADFLAGYLSHGFYQRSGAAALGAYGCSTLCVRDEEGETLFGRNYDWTRCQTMIVHSVPREGYESLSTCCLDFLGFGEDYVPDGSMADRMQTLAAIYVPLDGMNEKGLVVADLMAGDREETHQRTDKTDLTTTAAIRLLLDRAATVEEAVALLEGYDMNSSIGSAHHFAIADATGRSVVVEYVDGRMCVTDTRVVTNHYLGDHGKRGVGSEQSHLRFDALSAFTGTADGAKVRDLLESVAQKNYPQTEGSYEKTMWSIVYRPARGRADFYFDEDYQRVFRLALGGDDFLTREG